MSAAAQPRGDLVECARCTERLPFDANFCLRCGQAQRPEAAAFAPEGLERCEIVWWKGYVKGGFFVVPKGRLAPDVELPSSSLFWAFRAGRPDETGDAGAAHAALVARLAADGWTVAGRGSSWWSIRFTRGEQLVVQAPPPVPVAEGLPDAPAAPPVKPPPPPPPPPSAARPPRSAAPPRRARSMGSRGSRVLAKT